MCMHVSRIEHNLPSLLSSINELCVGICCTYSFSSVSVSRTDPASFILE